MSDFIYSSEQLEKGLLTNYFNNIYQHDEVLEFHGDWGSAAMIQNNLNTNNIFINKNYIIMALGNPHTLINLDKVFNDSLLNRHTDWSEKLNGPFLILFINKHTNNVHVITDLKSFIPLYEYKNNQSIFLSSHVDLLAQTTNQVKKKDKVSELDFILNGVTTFPYTSYKNIKQLSPSTEYNFKENKTLYVNQYWSPHEINNTKSIKEYGIELRESLYGDINNVLNTNSRIAHFISGGEDSRVISSAIKNKNKDGYTFLDNFNREGKIATKISEIYNSNLTIKYREHSYYLDILKDSSLLVGKGTEFKHAHPFDFVDTCNLINYDFVFGGLFADALLKGSHIKKDSLRQKLLFLPQKKNHDNDLTIRDLEFIHEDILKELNNRRQNHLDYIRKFRDESAYEWFDLYPSSMNNNVGNYHINRRLFNTYEPFLSNNIVKLSSEIPQDYKLNRKVFNAAFKLDLKPSKLLFHGDGFLPYYSWYINGTLQFIIKSYRKVLSFFNSSNQESWADWNKVVKTKKWTELVGEFSENDVSHIFRNLSVKDLFKKNHLTIYSKLNLMQIHFLNSIYN